MTHPIPLYSTQPSGPKTRILATDTGDHEPARTTTRTVVSLPPALADQVVTALTALGRRRIDVLLAWAKDHPGQVCPARRTLMAAVLTGTRADTPATSVNTLAALGRQVTDAERRALADEVGRLLNGTEDVIVPLRLTDEFEHPYFVLTANGWLTDAATTDADIVDAAAGTTDVLYECLLAYLRSTDEDIDHAADTQWVDVRLDTEATRAWVSHNRPDLLERVAAARTAETDGD